MIKEQYPYIDDFGVEHDDLVKHWTTNDKKIMLQVETGDLYEEAIDAYPCRFTYEEVDKPVEENEEEDYNEDA